MADSAKEAIAELEAKVKTLEAEAEEKQSVIGDLMNEISQKALEVTSLKKQVDQALQQSAQDKTANVELRVAKEQLEDTIAQLKL